MPDNRHDGSQPGHGHGHGHARDNHPRVGEHNKDLRGYATAYDARERLPDLAGWMSEDVMKQIPIWTGGRFERGQLYFDLDHPARGAFVADGDEGPISDHTYAARNGMSERAWAELITWQQPVSESQAASIDANASALGFGVERSAAGDARVVGEPTDERR